MPPTQQRLAGRDFAVLEIEDRLVMGLEAAVADRLTQFEFETSPRLGALIHAGFEEAIGPSAVAFRAVEREVGVLQQLIEIEPVARRNRDADRGVGGDQMPDAFNGLP